MKMQKIITLLLIVMAVPVLGAWTTAEEYYANAYGNVEFNNSIR